MERRSYKRQDRQPSLIRQQIADMKEALAAENRKDPLPAPVCRQDMADIDSAEKLPQADDAELVASLNRLERSGLQIAIREHPATFRIIENESQRGIALAQGFSIWAPRDMFEYIHLPPDQREKLRRFKKVFVEASFNWGKYRG